VSMARFVVCDPEQPPASELLAEMAGELNELYGTPSRLDHPAVLPSDLRAPGGTFLVGWEGQVAVAGGGVRRFGEGVGEIKRMFVRPAARSRGIAAELLTALEYAARTLGYRRVRLDTGPKQPHAESLYRRTGFVPIAAYNDNPFASFWGEKALDLPQP
jgi:GNAT superfamily N-acetyltransferase